MATTQELITKAKTFDPSQVTYKPVRVNSKGGKSIPLSLNGHNLVLQYPLMFTWGVNEWDSDSGTFKKYDMNLQFGTDEGAEGAFLSAMKVLQEKILVDSVKNSFQWFGKKTMSREVAEALMYPILKYPKDKQTGEPDMTRYPAMKLKIPCWEGDFKVELYDMNRNALYLPNASEDDHWDKTPVDLIPSRSHVKGLLECTGLWFAGGKFGCSWKLVQAQVRPPVRIQGFCILDDSDDDEVAANLMEQDLHTNSTENNAPEPKSKKKPRGRKKKVVAKA